MSRRSLFVPDARAVLDDFMAPFAGWYQVIVDAVDSSSRPSIVYISGRDDLRRSMAVCAGGLSFSDGGPAFFVCPVYVAQNSSSVLAISSGLVRVCGSVQVELEQGALLSSSGAIRAVHYLGSSAVAMGTVVWDQFFGVSP